MIGMIAPFIAAACVAAHPYHVATGEADLNAETGRLEVAMAFDPADLDKGLTAFAGEDIDLEDAETVGPLFERYLAGCWSYRPIDRDDKARLDPGPSFVGMEFEGRTAWVYFTVAFPEDPGLYEIGLWALMEAEPALEIGLRLRLDKVSPPRSLVFKTDARWQRLTADAE